MSDFDLADCMDRYRALVTDRPERLRNPDDDICEILLGDHQIDHRKEVPNAVTPTTTGEQRSTR